jgi:excisionase family DNA binding protein
MESKVTLLNENDVYNIVNSVVEKHVAELRKDFQPKEQDAYMTRTEVSQLLRCDLSTIWMWCKKGKLRSHNIGNRVLFKRSEILEAVKPIKHEG